MQTTIIQIYRTSALTNRGSDTMISYKLMTMLIVKDLFLLTILLRGIIRKRKYFEKKNNFYLIFTINIDPVECQIITLKNRVSENVNLINLRAQNMEITITCTRKNITRSKKRPPVASYLLILLEALKQKSK